MVNKGRNISILAIISALAACSDFSGGDSAAITVTVAGVYMAGTYGDKACYWKDGERTALPSEDRHAEANSIAVTKNGDVYIAGETGNRACYWKNGVLVYLPVPSGTNINSSASSVALAPNGDVYITGDYGVFTSGGSYSACYWKNEERIVLPTPAGTRYPEANSVAVTENGDVYIAGGYGNASTNTACYWKNDERTDLPVPNGTSYAEANDIVVASNGDVYIAGGYNNGDSGRPCYWKNGVRTDLSAPARIGGSYARDIAVTENGDVYVYVTGNTYIAGDSDESTAYYWKNRTRINLPVPAGARYSIVYDITVTSNGDVYVAGYYYNKDIITTCYWKNEERIDLFGGFINDIMVVTP